MRVAHLWSWSTDHAFYCVDTNLRIKVKTVEKKKGMQRKKNHGVAVMRGWGMMEREWVTALWSSLV